MPGERASWLVVAGLGAAVVLRSTIGCLPEPSATADADQAALLADVGPEVVIPALARFRAAAVGLSEAVGAWEAGGGEAAREAARAPYLAALLAWQEAELYQVGPAGDSLSQPGGAGLRDEIYSWPTTNPCRVDQETFYEAFRETDFFSTSLVNVYGLDALEHLLFAPAEGNACPAEADINADGGWAGLGEVDGRRAAYAGAAIAHVLSTTDTLIEAWEGEYGASLADPSRPGSPYGSPTEALDSVFGALFYLELATADRKLAEPLGLGSCAGDCGGLVEAIESGASSEAVAANLRGFRALWTGGEGAGFDDLLEQRGHGDLSAQLLERTDAALALADGLDAPIDALLASDPARVSALYEGIEAVTELLGGDIATVLALELPDEAAGDND